jgi:DNA invertase Pin-like site-specific DNA recombinase
MDSSEVAVWIVLRKSRDEENDPEILAKHRATLTRLLLEDGHDPARCRWVEEIGSSETIDRRPEFRQALQEWQRLPRRAGGRVYAMGWDRISKGSMSQQGLIQDTMRRAGLLLRTPSGLFDLCDTDDDFNIDAQGFIGRAEQRLFRKRVNEARQAMVRDGRLLTGKESFGYDWDYKQKVPVPNADFPVLQALYRDALHSSSYQLAKKYGKPAATILYILRNPRNCGWPAKRWFPHGGDRPWVGPSELRPRAEWLWPEKPGDYPAACTREEWERVQEVLTERNDRRAKTHSDHGWCVGVVRFSGQENPVRLGVYTYPGHKTLTYESPRKGGRLYIAREVVHAAAEEHLFALVARPAPVLASLQRYRDRQAAQAVSRSTGSVLEAVSRDLEKERAAFDRLNRRLLEEEDEEEIRSLTSLKRQIRARLNALQEQARALQQQPVTVPALDVLDVTADTLARLGSQWEGFDNRTRRLWVEAFLSDIHCICEPVEGRRAWRREVVGVRPRNWLQFMSK